MAKKKTGPELLKRWREGCQMNQREAAAKLGMSPSQYCDYEHGRKGVGMRMARKFHDIAGIAWEVWT